MENEKKRKPQGTLAHKGHEEEGGVQGSRERTGWIKSHLAAAGT
jgi:hypothetical protein